MRSRTPARKASRSAPEDGPRVPRALLTATVLSHIAQFHQPAIDLLKEAGYEVHVAARNNLDQKPGLTLTGVDRVIDVPFERSPLTPKNFSAARRLRQVLRDTDYDLIHCHTPVAGLLTRLCGQRSRRRGARMLYTAHGFHFFKGAPLANWLVYYPIEWLSAFGTDVLITINQEDFRRAARFPSRSVEYIPGVGVDVHRFGGPIADPSEIRRSLGLAEDAFVVLSIGELNANKNHQTVIRALSMLEDANIRYLICGNGPLLSLLQDQTEELGLDDRVQFLGYRRDIPALLAIADLFCLPSFREGLPLALMEAMASGKAVVASRIRGVSDLLPDTHGGMSVPDPRSVDGFTEAIRTLAGDDDRRQTAGAHNREYITAFSSAAVIRKLRRIYLTSGQTLDEVR